MNRAKIIDTVLILLVVFLAYQFGFSVGDYYARSIRARQDARKILADVEATFKPKGDSGVGENSKL